MGRYGLATMAAVLTLVAPTMDALVDIGSIVMGFDGWAAARDVDKLGIKNASLDALATHLATGRHLP